ncbi:hypothetical protein H6CHR_02358 [Variovorax sp. PBL-H6]|nr:hypothetical protein H6CHR_02358 [Variovorax sp. PBL-H6]
MRLSRAGLSTGTGTGTRTRAGTSTSTSTSTDSSSQPCALAGPCTGPRSCAFNARCW